MNVLICAGYNPPFSGNFIASIVELGRRLKAEGDFLTTAFPENANTKSSGSWTKWLEREGHKVYLVDAELPCDKQLAFLQTVISDNNIDLLHSHFGLFHDCIISNRKDIMCRILIHEHMEYPAGCNRTVQTLKFMGRSLAYRVLNCGMISVNEQVDRAHIFARHWFIPNGISFVRNTERSMSREEKRTELGFLPDDKVVLFLGWDLHRKGIDVAIKAVDRLRCKNEKYILAVVGVGEGSAISSQAEEFIRRSTSIDPYAPWIRYIVGGEDMFATHRAADVYLSASRSEAFSYGIIEAISQNVPVVVSDIKGTSWSWDYDKSFVYPVEDNEKCAEEIEKAVCAGNAPSNFQQMSDRFSIDRWCDRIIRVYHEM